MRKLQTTNWQPKRKSVKNENAKAADDAQAYCNDPTTLPNRHYNHTKYTESEICSFTYNNYKLFLILPLTNLRFSVIHFGVWCDCYRFEFGCVCDGFIFVEN